MTQLESVVIVGGGLAAANAAFALRQRSYAGRVVIVSAETTPPYERPPMSKEYLRGEKTIEQSYVQPADAYREQGIDLVAGRRAVALDPATRSVILDDKRVLRYDAVLLATGSAARHLDVPGADLSGVHYLRDVADADELRSAALAASSIVVIGGGWIGTEVAASLRQLGRNVTLVSAPPQPLERVLGAEVAGVYRHLHEERGTRILIGRVAGIEGDDRVRAVVLGDGTKIPADVVVPGIGGAPRIELAQGAGLAIRDGGVQVDQYLETSAPGVFAAGDIATAWHPRYGRYLRVEHWDNAIEQGKTAAANILGAHSSYERTPYFYSDQFDLGMEYRGLARAWDEVVIRGDIKAREFDAFWLKDHHVVAAMNANRWDDAAELQELVDRDAIVDPDELVEPRLATA